MVFEGETHDLDSLLERSQGALAPDGDEGLRIRLRIASAPMAHLPWELLYSRRRDGFLATEAATALVRYLELSQPVRSLETAFPIRVLVVIPEAEDLDAALERRIVQEATSGLLAKGRRLEITWLDGQVTLQRLNDALRLPHHLVHFVGHGGFADDQPFLRINDDPPEVGHEAFAALFRNHPSMKLVVLNSCQGAEVSATRPLLGMAPELVKRGVPAVIAMKYVIDDAQAIDFAREFYQSLFLGEDRGRVEVAISHARNWLASRYPDDRVVACPVLFTRAPEGVLFSLPGRGALGGLPLRRRELHGAEATIRTHQTNLALMGPGDEKDQAVRELARLRARVRLRNWGLAAAFAVGVVMAVLGSLQMFDRLPPELRLKSYTAWVGDAFRSKTFRSDAIALVATDQKPGRSWRARHAAVVRNLAEAGARVVALDFTFREPDDAQDAQLAAAIRQARQRGTDVVVAVSDHDGTVPVVVPALRDAATSWGVACVGHQSIGATSIVPVVTEKAGWTLPALSLSLAAVRAYRRDQPSFDALEFSDVERTRSVNSKCPIVARGDTVRNRVIDTSPVAALDDATLRYEAVEAGEFDRSRVAGRIVVVGSSAEAFGVLEGLLPRSRSGMELHADAINTLLSGVTIRPLAEGWQILITLAMAGVGALLQYADLGGKVRWAGLALAVAVYLAGNVWLYASRQLILNALFQVGALVLTYWLVGRFKRRWYT